MWSFSTVGRIVFGVKSRLQIAKICKEYGTRVAVVCGRDPSRISWLFPMLDAEGLTPVATISVSAEPSVAQMQAESAHLRALGCHAILGIGGGSVMDAAKALSALVPNQKPPVSYLEVVGDGSALTEPCLPTICCPTTAGTGSEVTRNAVLTYDGRTKVSLRSITMLPKCCVVDPELSVGLASDVTLSTGMDALTQLIEAYISNAPSPVTDVLCVEGISRVARSLSAAVRNGADLNAREDMSFAALLSGIALSNAKLGAVHGFAGSIGGMFAASHGAVCASLLHATLRVVARALRAREPHSAALPRLQHVAQLLTGNPGARVEDGLHWIDNVLVTHGSRRLAALGVTKEAFSNIIPAAQRSSSMKGSPILLTEGELAEILQDSL